MGKFLCTLDFLVPVPDSPTHPEPYTIFVGSHDFDPGFQVGEEVNIIKEISGKVETFESIVLARRFFVTLNELVIQDRGFTPEESEQIAENGGLVWLRITLEPKDRDLMVKFGQTLRIRM
ncbi:MAG: hypothetical protein AAGA60_09370 [Cyanobacteria bacterium P01_E01_bin.42]